MGTSQTTNKGLYVITPGTEVDVWGGYINDTTNYLDACLGTVTTISITGSNTYTLNNTECRATTIIVSGVLNTGNVIVKLTNGISGQFTFINTTTQTDGTSTLKAGWTSSGNTVTIKQGSPGEPGIQILTGNGNTATWYPSAPAYPQTVSSASLTIGSTTIFSGNSTRILYDSSAIVQETTAGITTDGTKLTLAGSSSSLAAALANAGETTTVSGTAATGTINYDVTTQSVLYYTTAASGNWTVNFRGSSGTSLNTVMSIGQTLTVVFLVTQGATAYINSVVQIDSSTVTPLWQGGTAPATGDINSVDIYTYAIVKTGDVAFTVFASQTKFA